MPIRKDSNGLTPKQKKFCQESLKDFNGAAAYGRTYNSKGTDASAARLLAKPSVQQYLNLILNQAEEVAQVSLAAVVREAGRLAFSDITEAMEFDEQGVTFKNSSVLPKRVTASIQIGRAHV